MDKYDKYYDKYVYMDVTVNYSSTHRLEITALGGLQATGAGLDTASWYLHTHIMGTKSSTHLFKNIQFQYYQSEHTLYDPINFNRNKFKNNNNFILIILNTNKKSYERAVQCT